MKEFAQSEWERALRTAKSAEGLVETDPDSAASRAYYAAFHAVSALFALQGRAFSRHSALRAAVHRDLVNTGHWEADMGRDYDFLMDLREMGDYGGFSHVTVENAKTAVQSSQRIIGQVRSTCPDLIAAT